MTCESQVRRREYTGYLYVIPYAGDGYILTSCKIEGFENMRPIERLKAVIEKLHAEDTVTIADIFSGLENRKVRIIIEMLED